MPNALTHADRLALGLAARKQLTRSAHAEFSASTCKHDPLDLLRAAERDRIPRLVKIKHERMAANPFGFFRGAVPIMAADLACHPNTGLLTHLCGDAHVANLGAYGAGAASLSSDPASRLVFDINDFDETIRDPFEFDLKRLATSILLAGRLAGIKRTVRRDAVLHFACRYRESMRHFSTMPVLELACYQIHRLAQIDPMPAILAQAERSTPLKSLKSLTEPIPAPKSATRSGAPSSTRSLTARQGGVEADGPDPTPRRFQSHPPLLTRLATKERDLVLAALGPTPAPAARAPPLPRPVPTLDVAFKVVGTGSVGLRDYCIYLEAISRPAHTDPLFLQFKEEPASAYAAYLPDGDTHTHQGHRVMDGQRAMQLTSDPFLGYTTIEGRDFLVRQLNDHKATIDVEKLDAKSLLGYADLCGELFARSHARAGDPVTIAAYLGTNARFDHALLTFARAYADKTEHDFDLFKHSLKTSR